MNEKQKNKSPEEMMKENMNAPSTALPSDQDILNVLTAVEDPELHINIIDLGLIYKIDRDEKAGKITVDMTLTTPACPYGPQLLSATHAVVNRLPNVKEVKVNPVFTPRWDPHVHASETARMLLGLI